MRRSDPAAVRDWRERGARAYALRRRMRLAAQEEAEEAAPGQRRENRLRRHTRLRPVNKDPARRQRRFERAFLSREYVGFIHSQNCSAPGCTRRDIECAHVGKPRSRGGRWYEIAPLCAHHHREQEKRTAWFNATYHVDLEAIAARLAFDHLAFLAEPAPHRSTHPQASGGASPPAP